MAVKSVTFEQAAGSSNLRHVPSTDTGPSRCALPSYTARRRATKLRVPKKDGLAHILHRGLCIGKRKSGRRSDGEDQMNKGPLTAGIREVESRYAAITHEH